MDDLVKRLREPYEQRQSRRVADEFQAADRIEALERQVKAEREKALREAVSLSWLCFHKCDVEIDVVTVEDILALISEDKTDE